ncbi:hypothetical protein MOVS_08180 [Moraxella ovis]|uniref:Secreted protein n=1 Tax=Moraxella ovis TaxID=29433 RepID=A0ABM6BDV9_9GAMM|nr:hypothetical protein MOVS_08180 [Moraxella ovis]
MTWLILREFRLQALAFLIQCVLAQGLLMSSKVFMSTCAQDGSLTSRQYSQKSGFAQILMIIQIHHELKA